MTIKIVKLMIAVSLATVFGISAFMESAEAEYVGGDEEYSLMSVDATSVGAQFILVGTPIIDDTNFNNDIGLFVGAIENYTTGTGRLTAIGARDNIGNLEFQNPFEPDPNPIVVANLEASLIKPSPFQNDEDEFVIQYKILGQGINNVIKTSLLRPSLQSEPFELDQDQAINSLSYILENNLLGRSSIYETTGEDGEDGEDTEPFFTGSFLVNSLTMEEENPDSTTVPEPTATASLFVMGTLSAWSLLKRKIKLS